MKRITLLLLLLTLTLCCLGCQGETDSQHAFYYLRTNDTISYGQEDALITAHFQDLGPEMELDTILQLYLDGPMEENLRSPFPRGTYLLGAAPENDILKVILSREFSTLDGIQLTLAGACLTATCRDLTGFETIQIRSGEKIYDFDINSFIFLDSSPEQ